MRFCLLMAKIMHISYKDFEILNFLSVTEIFNQCISSTVFKYLNNRCPNYFNKILEAALENTFF